VENNFEQGIKRPNNTTMKRKTILAAALVFGEVALREFV